ncbi:carbohydrate esterase family 16 protein [Cylindrobasidium torrendii FP15055 ss-10]|uniref:Carbohydrate esterase family 16 protein n=1 Tax=Cylindrobasidium torrendii FP15055 ss-10 TaxID=1314674 RepID=A0A0D7BNT8_9AGAR|nr:carbohydrate esterase family 16 protein [Cylindrobasidium torrendii FP15055 ss-10]
MSRVFQRAPGWHSFSHIKRLVIFGDSYSSVLLALNQGVKPTASLPLSGQKFPGHVWNEPGMPNWVGHLLTQYRDGPLFQPEGTNDAWNEDPLLVYDYALGGNTLDGVQRQVNVFLRDMASEMAATWKAEETLFVSWIGINDCAYSTEHEDNIEKLFSMQEQLYMAGARNILFIDVPPMWRIPGVRGPGESSKAAVASWNSNLVSKAEKFSSQRPDVTCLLWSSFDASNTILDRPKEHRFDRADLKKSGGGIWVDHIHPTSAYHNHIAKYLTDFLKGI